MYRLHITVWGGGGLPGRDPPDRDLSWTETPRGKNITFAETSLRAVGKNEATYKIPCLVSVVTIQMELT